MTTQHQLAHKDETPPPATRNQTGQSLQRRPLWASIELHQLKHLRPIHPQPETLNLNKNFNGHIKHSITRHETLQSIVFQRYPPSPPSLKLGGDITFGPEMNSLSFSLSLFLSLSHSVIFDGMDAEESLESWERQKEIRFPERKRGKKKERKGRSMYSSSFGSLMSFSSCRINM